MLIYKKKDEDQEAIEIMYDQKPITVEPGKSLDVRDFGVGNESILAVERHVLLKNPGIFDQQKTKDILETNKAHIEKIAVLEKEVIDLSERALKADKGCRESQEKLQKVLTENEGFKNKNKSLVGEVGELKAKVKALS